MTQSILVLHMTIQPVCQSEHNANIHAVG